MYACDHGRSIPVWFDVPDLIDASVILSIEAKIDECLAEDCILDIDLKFCVGKIECVPGVLVEGVIAVGKDVQDTVCRQAMVLGNVPLFVTVFVICWRHVQGVPAGRARVRRVEPRLSTL